LDGAFSQASLGSLWALSADTYLPDASQKATINGNIKKIDVLTSL
jgi:hypothetical protein